MTAIPDRVLGHRLHVVRNVLGLSEAEAATAHGVTVKTYRKWESGDQQRSIGPTLKFAERYDVSLDWLFDGDGYMLHRHLAVNRGGKLAILPIRNAARQRRLAS